MSAPLLRGAARVKRALAGVLFLAVLTGLVATAIASYNKAFTDVVMVTLEADRAGNQLSKGADVKLRGVLVGEVREVRSTGDGARLRLALKPEMVPLVPRDVQARLRPKTLFGEKEVQLVTGAASGAPLREGDVIPQDRSETARETEEALDDLLPLLRTLKPEQVSLTLNAVSSALRGRGARVGQNLALADEYFRELNPSVPGIVENFRGIADVSESYAAASDDFLAVLDNLSEVNRDLVDQREELDAFLSSTTSSVDEMDRFLRENERRLVRLAEDSLPSLLAYARYSPQYPCMLRALNIQQKEGERVFGGRLPGLHITLEVTEDQNAYVPGDEPQYREDKGPTCRGLDKRIVPYPVDQEVRDGYCDEEEQSQPGVQNGCPREPEDGDDPDSPSFDPARFLGEEVAIRSVVAPVMGVPMDQVPDLATLLFGPLARGTTVGVA